MICFLNSLGEKFSLFIKVIYDLLNEKGDDVIFEFLVMYSNIYVDNLVGFVVLFLY